MREWTMKRPYRLEQDIAEIGSWRVHMTILISIGKQADGCTYELHPRSWKEISDKYSHARQVPSVFVGYKTREEFEELHGPMWKQIAMALTGLTWSQLEKMGGVAIYDPVAQREIKAVA